MQKSKGYLFMLKLDDYISARLRFEQNPKGEQEDSDLNEAEKDMIAAVNMICNPVRPKEHQL